MAGARLAAVRIVGMAILALVLVVACTSDDATPPATPPNMQPTQTPPPGATAPEDEIPLASDAVALVLADKIEVREFASWQPGSAVVETLERGDRVPVAGQLFMDPQLRHAWLLIPGRGWIRHEPELIQLDVGLAELPEVPTPVHPAHVRSGDDAVDRVIDAVLARDTVTLAGLAQLEARACGGRDTGDFPCPQGVERGAPVEVFTFVACHGQSHTADELPEAFERWLPTTTTEGSGEAVGIGLYAVRSGADSVDAVFALTNGEARVLRVDGAGRIRYADRGCGPTPPEMVVAGAADFIVPPPGRIEAPARSVPGPDEAANPWPAPDVGETITVDPIPVAVRLVPGDQSKPQGLFYSFLYDLEADELVRAAGVWNAALSPFSDRALARAGSLDRATWETVLFDLASGEAVRVLPPIAVNVFVLSWPSPDRLFLSVRPFEEEERRLGGWRRGVYELDLAAMRLTFLWKGEPGDLSRDGSTMVTIDAFGVRARNLLTGESVTLVEERELQGWAPGAWSPVDAQYAFFMPDGEVRLLDASTGEIRVIADLGVPPRVVLNWSPDGRYLSAVSAGETWIVDASGESAPLGPYREARAVGWRPDGTELLVLAEWCGPDGFWLETVDAASGALTRIPTEQHGFWFQQWASDGELIVAGAIRDGVYLIDPVTGATRAIEAFGDGVDSGDFPAELNWSASGRWLFGNVDLGRGRCAV